MDLPGKTCNRDIPACASTEVTDHRVTTSPRGEGPAGKRAAGRLAGLVLAAMLAGCAAGTLGLPWAADKDGDQSTGRPAATAPSPVPASGPEGGTAGSGQQEGRASGPTGHDYVYNLPHRVPPDYVYRTERVFAAHDRTVPPGGQAGATPPPPAATPADAERLVTAIRSLAADIVRQGEVDTDAQVIVTTFVNLDDLYRTSGLGRLLQETAIHALRRAGLSVIEVRKTPSILVRQRFGEYGLSRDIEEIPYVHLADAVMVGTYRQAAGQLFVAARLLDNTDNQVLGSAETVLPVSALISDLLADERVVPARRAVAIPVRREGEP